MVRCGVICFRFWFGGLRERGCGVSVVVVSRYGVVLCFGFGGWFGFFGRRVFGVV